MTDYALVEKMLPARFLTEIGIYLQSAAHLELAIWQIIMFSENQFNPKGEAFEKFVKIKISTERLIQELRSSTKNLNPALALRVAQLAGQIKTGLENRNLAAHGAFFKDDDTLKVSHYFVRGKKSGKEWFQANDQISRQEISQAIEDIDILLREAIDIRNEIKISAGER